jgi:hypothetical protein
MSWFKKPLNIGITIGAALLAVAAIFLIVWGVTHHTEGEMLEVCWSEDGHALYVSGSEEDHGACEGAQELLWPQEQIPLTLAPVSSDGQPLAADAPEVRVLHQAVDDLNRQVAFELYRVGAGLQPSDAEVRFGGAFLVGAERASPPPGYVSHARLGGGPLLRGYAWIRSDVGSDDRTLYLVLQHELLHLAGLEHDDFPMSIMYPFTHEEWEHGTMSTAHVTDLDIDNLQRRYRRE